MGWGIGFGIVLLLAVLPLGIHIRYNESGLRANLILGPLKILLFPKSRKNQKPKTDKKKKKPAPQKEKKKAAAAGTSAKTAKKEKGGSWTDFLPLVQVAMDFLNGFRRKLRINNLELKLIMAGGDPCDLAVNYGRAWAALGNLMPRLEQVLVIKKRDIQIECDFTASSATIIAGADVTITLGRLLSLVAVAGFRAVKEFLIIKKKRKGGAAL